MREQNVQRAGVSTTNPKLQKGAVSDCLFLLQSLTALYFLWLVVYSPAPYKSFVYKFFFFFFFASLWFQKYFPLISIQDFKKCVKETRELTLTVHLF